MRWALILMVLGGIAIGWAVPVHRAPGPVAEAAPTPAPPPKPTRSGPASKPFETILRSDGAGRFVASAEVEGQPVRFIVDTGADLVALTMEDARRAGIDFDPARFEVVGRGASGDVMGQPVMIDEIVLDGKRARNVRGAVLAGLDISLLGQSYLRQLGSVHMTGDEMRLR